MPNLLETGAAWLADKRHEHLTTSVTYRRGGNSVTLQATIGRSEFASDSAEPIIETWQARDYIIRVIDLVLAGAATTPERGDTIDETQGAIVYQYEVMAPPGQTPWRYADDFRREFRIHTKHVGTT